MIEEGNVPNSDQTLVILEKVNSFYNQSFSNLIALTAILLAFVGVIIPLLINLYQSRKLTIERSELQKNIDDSLRNLKKETEEYVENKVKEKTEAIDKKLESFSLHAKAQTMHVQGFITAKSGDAPSALEDFAKAGIYYIKAGDELNLQLILDNIIDVCLPHCNQKNIRDDKCKKRLDEFIEELEKFNENSRYTNAIQNLRKALKEANERKQ